MKNASIALALLLTSAHAALAAAIPAPGSIPEPRPPIVIIPGAPGTELIDTRTGERVWPSAARMTKKDGNAILALPVDDPESSPIVAGGLLRVVHVAGLKFPIRAYGGLERRLRELGYREGSWTSPSGTGEYFYFTYDWRQSVETNGRRFSRGLDALYARLPPGTPPAIVLGHSLGGMIARYGLMYGDTPLGSSGPLPQVTWAQGAHIGTLFLVATPNEGTFLALQRLEKGIFYRHGRGAFSPETLFTYPSVFDMIPARPAPLVDREGHPLPFDLDNAEDWERLGWSILDPDAHSRIPYAARREHLAAELARIERLHAAMSQRGSAPDPAKLYAVGSLSRSVQRTALLSDSSRGMKIRFDAPPASRARLNPLLFEPGDTMVPVRSLKAESSDHDPAGSLGFARILESKSKHGALLSSPETLEALGEALK